MNKVVYFRLTSKFKKELKRLEKSGDKKSLNTLKSVIRKIISHASSDSSNIDLSEFKPDPFENAGDIPHNEKSNKILHLHLNSNEVLIYLIYSNKYIIDVRYTTIAKHDDYEREGKWKQIQRLAFQPKNKLIADFTYSKPQIEYVETCFKKLVENETLNLDSSQLKEMHKQIISEFIRNTPDNIQPFSSEDFYFVLRTFLEASNMVDILESKRLYAQPIFSSQEILPSEVEAIFDLICTYNTIIVSDYEIESTDDEVYGEFITLFIDCVITNADDKMLFDCELRRLLRPFGMNYDLVENGRNSYTYEIFHYID